MQKLSYTLAALAVLSFSILPANAVKKEITNNTIVPDATEQINKSINPQGCLPYPYEHICW